VFVEIKFEAFVKDFDAMKRYIMAPDVAEIEKREHIISGLRKRQSDLNSQLSDATNKIQELEQQKQDCEEKAKEKVQEIAELLDDWVEDCEELHAEIQRLQTRVNKKDENTAELQASCVTLNIQLEEIKSELATKNTLVTQLFATQQQLQNQLVDEKNRMDEQLRNRQDRLDHEENWLRMIEDNLKDQKDCVEKLSAENQSLYDDKVLLIKDTKRLKQEVSAKEAKINNLVLRRTEDYKKISPLQRKLDAAEAEKFELKEDVLELESQLQHVKRDLTNLIDHDRGQQDTERVQTVIANITFQLQRRQGGLRRAPSTPNPRPSNSRPSPRPQSRRNPQGATLAQETIIDLIITLSDSQIEELELLSSIREYQEEARLGRHWVKGVSSCRLLISVYPTELISFLALASQ